MPYCPKCRYEYRPEISQCPDCNERLVATLPMEPENKPVIYENWTEIARFTSTQYGEMLVEALRSKDIPALLRDATGHFGQIGAMGMTSYAPVPGAYATLLIPDQFVEQACQEAEAVMGEEWAKIRLL